MAVKKPIEPTNDDRFREPILIPKKDKAKKAPSKKAPAKKK